MTGDKRGGGDNPVGEFFAAHRAQVQDEPADDLTWQRIRDGHRGGRSRRRRAWGGGLLAAAAALALVAGPSLLPDAEEPDLAGATDEPSVGPSTEAPTNESIPDPLVVTTGVPEGGLPTDGRFTDVTTADPELGTDTGVRYAVMMHPCTTSGWCSILAAAEDGDTTWAPRADLEKLGMVHRAHFVDHLHGWVWGDKAPIWTTTDGGRTWSGVDISADFVADLAVQGDTLLATTWTYDDCSATPCQPERGSVVLADPTDIQWSDDVARDLGPVERAGILGSADTHYVVVSSTGGLVSDLLRLQDGQLEATAELSSCDGGPATITATTDAPEHLWALCDDQRGLALHESSNGGRTWSPTNLTIPSFVLGEQPPLMASVDADRLLLVGEGNFTVSTDGGQTWSNEEFLPGAESRPERLEVTMFGEILIYPTAEQASVDLAYWQSDDGGDTWQVRSTG